MTIRKRKKQHIKMIKMIKLRNIYKKMKNKMSRNKMWNQCEIFIKLKKLLLEWK